MKDKIILVVLIISLSINAGVVIAFFLHNPLSLLLEREPSPWKNGQFFNHLDLTQEQTERIHNMKQETFSQIAPLKNKIHETRRELMDIIKQEIPDKAKAENLIHEIGELRSQIEFLIFQNMAGVKKMLTSDQQTRFFNFVEKRFLHQGMGRGMGQGHGRF